MKYKRNLTPLVSVVIAVLVLAALGYGGWRFYVTAEDLSGTRGELEKTRVELNQVTIDFEWQISELRDNLTRVQNENIDLSGKLIFEQSKNAMFAEQISGIAGTVGVLEKLSKTDKELLQKYSKIYFLNEHYVPSELVQIPQKYLAAGNDEEWIHAKVWPRLETMLDAASRDGAVLSVVSGYRSFDMQTTLKYGYKVTYGSGANKFSADQGYSEHQLGTTVDFTTPSMGTSLTTQFEKKPEYQWLISNAYRYGFALSYPKGNAYYQFEPWHWRFVGVDLATKLHNEGKYFYDLDQREIDGYLVSIFD